VARRLAHAGWVLDYLDDIESDLSAVHRVDDIHTLTSERFFRLANRLVHYQGAVRDMVTARLGAESSGRTAPSPAVSASSAPPVVTDLAQVRELRRQARLREFPVEKFGEHREVPLEEAMRGIRG
jgi:hypothetical protein